MSDLLTLASQILILPLLATAAWCLLAVIRPMRPFTDKKQASIALLAILALLFAMGLRQSYLDYIGSLGMPTQDQAAGSERSHP